jgi:small-conductance mechanosensitive channel
MFRIIFILIFFYGMVAPNGFAAFADKEGKPEKAATNEETNPPEGQVMINSKPLFTVKGKVFSFSPVERARLISDRLSKLMKSPLFKADSVTTIDGDVSSDIVAGDTIIMSVTEKDAVAAGQSRQDLARDYAGKIRSAIEAHNREYNMHSILFGALYTLLATLTLVIFFAAGRRLFPRIIKKIESWRGTRIRTLRIQSMEILHEDRIVSILTEMVKWTRILLFLMLLFLYFPFVFSFFPWTRGLSSKIFEYIVTPVEKIGHGVASYIPKIFYLFVIVVLTHFAVKIARFLFAEVEKQNITLPGFYPEWAEPTFKIVRFMMIAFALVVAFPYLPGAESPAFKGVTIFLGVLLSLGSTSAVANVVAGVILTYMRALNLGDRVKIAETVGDVVEKNLLVTRIRTIKNVDITIPNIMVLGSHVINYSSSAKSYGLILHTSVTIGYDAPWRKVHELLISAAVATENILQLPPPFVLQTSLNDFYVTYELNAYSDKPSVMARTYSELHQHIQDKFNEAGVEIMSPHFSQLRDGNTAAIPHGYLPKDYVAPSFRVSGPDRDKG